MRYDHSSDFESGNSMGQNDSGNSNSPSGSRSGSSTSGGSASAKPESALKCSYCGQSFFRSETRHMPFCSKRCQQIDLGMWLNESYGFPCEGESTLDNHGIKEDDPWADDEA